MAEASAGPARRLPHGLRRMTGRDVHEHERTATPLELLYDLTVVVAFSVSGGLFAHSIAFGHALQGSVAFAFSCFAIVWAWISYTWFASAYDTDDWAMRLGTLVQMVGIIVIALGLPDVFHGFEDGELHNRIMVAGYVTMRASMAALWLRAAADDPVHRPTLLTYVRLTLLAQVGWVVVALTHLPWAVLLPLLLVLYALEMGAVWLAERRRPIPWHPHHIAERYGLLAIISLGEIVLGTTVAVQALVEHQGWSLDAVIVVAAGISIAFGLWWMYFGLPFGEALALQHEKGTRFGVGHIALYGSIAAVGAGLHVAAYFVEQENGTTIGLLGTVLSVAVPMAACLGVAFWLAHQLLPGRDRLHTALLGASALVIGAGVFVAAAGAPLSTCLLVLMIVPWITVVGYETRGHEHLQRVLDRLHSERAEVADP